MVDPNGKQADFSNFMGMFPEQWRSQAVQNEVTKLEIHAAKPAAISIPLSLSFFGIGFTGFSLTPTWILKGPDQGFHLFGSFSFGLNADSGNGGNIGLMAYWLKGDERNLSGKSFLGKSDDYSLGYKAINIDYSTFNTDEGDKMEGYGLSLSSPRLGPKKLQILNPSLEVKKTLTFDVVEIFSKANKNKEQRPKTKESTNHYYLRTLTNFPESWYENQ